MRRTKLQMKCNSICNDCFDGDHVQCMGKGCDCSCQISENRKFENWEIEFDEKFQESYGWEPSGDGTKLENEIKSFISSLLASQKARTIDEETTKNKEWFDKGVKQTKSRIVEMVEGMVDIGALAAGTPQAMEHNAGWESFKHHLLSTLTDKKETQ